jgi:hypothetical protein
MTIAFEVESDDPEMPSFEEAWAGFEKRYLDLKADPEEADEALLSEYPFDTYEVEDEDE